MPLDYLHNAWPVLLAGDAPAGTSSPSLMSLIFPVTMIMVLFYFMLIRPEQNKRKAHQSLLSSLKKNDRIVTVGGIYGVVTNVQQDADEVIVKIDESNNTKIRITFGSVARVITGGADGDKQGKS